MTKWKDVPLARLVEAAGSTAGERTHLPVYSVTKHRGFVPSLEYFKKQVFSRDLGSYTVVRPGELAYATIHLDEGSVGICPEPCLISPMYTAFRVTSALVAPAYLLRYLKSPLALREYPRLGKGSAERRKAISLERLGTLAVPLPPMEEQERIADALDRADGLRASRRAALALLDTLPQAIFTEMFGDPRTNPKGWPMPALSELTSIGTGTTPSRKDAANFVGTVPWVKTTEVDGDTILDTEEKISEQAARKCRVFPTASIIVALYGQGKTRGRCAELGIPAATNQACGVLLPNERYSTGFLKAQLTMAYERLRALGRGGNQENLNLGLVGGFKVVLPPLPLQQEFARRVAAVEEVRASQRAALAGLDELFTSLQHRAFRGEL